MDQYFLLLQAAIVIWVLVSFGAMHAWNRKRGHYFVDPPQELRLHDEKFASGRSFKSAFSRLGGASNCLKIMLTAERLYVRPIFPFQIVGPRFDLVHDIPLEAIVEVREESRFFGEVFCIRFRLPDGSERELHLQPKQVREFRAALGVAREARSGIRSESPCPSMRKPGQT